MILYQNKIFSKSKIPILIITDIFLCNLSLVISYSLRLEKFYLIYEIDKEILLYLEEPSNLRSGEIINAILELSKKKTPN